MVIVIMGPTGSGKTTVGRQLADGLGWQFVEGDDLHPPHNREKLARGEPLDDADRAPWLSAIADQIRAFLAAGTPAVIACSALKERYRRQLLVDAAGVRLVDLEVPASVLAARLATRHGHFVSPAILPSQLATHETPVAGALTVDANRPVATVVADIHRQLGLR
jgi:carbohydrate kinase (thermoresistant glucokinase family)